LLTKWKKEVMLDLLITLILIKCFILFSAVKTSLLCMLLGWKKIWGKYYYTCNIYNKHIFVVILFLLCSWIYIYFLVGAQLPLKLLVWFHTILICNPQLVHARIIDDEWRVSERDQPWVTDHDPTHALIYLLLMW
jgi:hypothetical protein